MTFQRCMLILLAIPLIAAVTITAPTADIEAEELPVAMLVAWETNQTPVSVTVSDGKDTLQSLNTSASNATFTLGAGTYTIRVESDNHSDEQTISIAQQGSELPTLSLTTDKQIYGVGDTVTLTAGSDTPVSADLDIERDGQTAETFTVNIGSSANLIYIPETPGAYTAILSADGASAQAGWTVEEVDELEIGFTHTTAVVNKRTNFTATATGGTAPYEYQWLFSDDTASTGKHAEHFFFEPGTYTATLVVTDDDGTQKSLSKDVTVTEKTYTLEAIVQDRDGDTLKDILVTIVDENGEDDDQKTSATGTVEFTGLRGVYNLTLSQLDTTYLHKSLTMDRDRNVLYTIDYGTANQTTDDTNQSDAEENATEEVEPGSEPKTVQEPQQMQTTSAEQTPEQTQQQRLEQRRAETKDAISQRRFNLELSASKDRVLEALGLDRRFDQALTEVRTAGETRLDELLDELPTDIRIDDDRQTVTYPDPEEMEEPIEAFLTARGVDEDLERSYRHSIRQTAENVSIKTRVLEATIIYPGRQQAHTIVSKDVTAPSGTYTVEVIPKSFAADASQLRIQGNHDILDADPVIRFNDRAFTYSAQGHTEQAGTSVVVPLELQEPGMLSGFVTLRFGPTSPTRGILYALLLGALFVGLTAGKRIVGNKRATAVFEQFSELAEHALELIDDGRGEAAADITPDILDIYADLPEDQRTRLSDLMAYLERNAKQQAFLQALQQVYTNISRDGADINIVSGVYHHILDMYEAMDADLQQQMRGHLDQLDSYLDQIVET